MSRTIGLVFCGGCNPRIDRGAVAVELKTALENLGFLIQINCRTSDYLIFINGCTAACAVTNCGSRPYAVVAAASVDSKETDPSCLGKEVLEKVMMIYG